MDAVTVIAIAIAVLVLVGLVAWAARRRSAVQLERARGRAADTRDLARVAESEAEQREFEARERAARAERERITAEQQRLDAEQRRQDAADLHRQADEIDPDVELEVGGEDTIPDAAARVEDPRTIDLREADATRNGSAGPSDSVTRDG